MDKPAFGARVRVGAVLKRVGVLKQRRWQKYWNMRTLTSKCEGIYIGYRTLYDGYVADDEYGVGNFYPEIHFQAALVVFSEHTRPVLVPFDALEVAP